MKCPLLTDKNYGAQLERTMASGDCLEADCAWWDEEKNACSIKVIAKELTRIQLKGHKL